MPETRTREEGLHERSLQIVKYNTNLCDTWPVIGVARYQCSVYVRQLDWWR